MAVDKNKIIAEATKLVQKGALDKAIATYQKILAEDPKDVRILLKVGELYQKRGEDKQAAEAFKKVAETYAEQGFFLKSVAVYKQIVKLDPEDVRVNERLAGLYQQLGLMSDAMSQYQLMAAACERAGDAARLTDVLRKMVELDPENIASSVKLGELCARSGQAGPALEHFRRAADHLKKHNRADEYLKIAERIAVLAPDDLALTRELANIYLAKGDTKRALAKLQLCFKADPKDVTTLNLLAQAFRDLGQTSKTVSVYKELAHVHAEAGRASEARATWRKVEELAPDDPDLAEATGGGAQAPPPPPPPTHATRAPPPGRPPAVAIAPPPPPSAGPPPAAAAEKIAKLVTEADVYVKYGLHDKALDHVRKILAVDPESPDGHEKAREIHAAAGRPADAAESAVRAVRALQARGQAERAREALARLRQLAPSHPALASLSATIGVTEEVALVDGEIEETILSEADSSDDDAMALAAADHGDEDVIDDEPVAAAVDDDEGIALDVDEPPPGPAAPPPRSARPPPPKAAPARAAPAKAPPARAPARGAAAEQPDLSDEIEEADFFLQQGLVSDARQALENLLALYPGHAQVTARLAELERKAVPARGRAAPPLGTPRESPPLVADSANDESFDIARELADELEEAPSGAAPADDDFQYSVEDVFSQFKKGVAQTVKKEDSATHYDLGIAYKEMGLVDDAIHEFETALAGNDRKKEVDCLTMIGLCRMAKAEPGEAVAAFRRALRSEHLSADAAKAVQFEVAQAYEEAGDAQAALWYLHKVAKADPRFRDVGGRISALGGGPGRAPAEADGPASRAGARPANGIPVRGAPARPPAGPAGSKKNIGYL
jgi:tetratricopeptide (TPR) repeat protein